MFSEVAPLRLTVYDRDFTRRGWLGDVLSVSCITRWCAPDTTTITVPSTSRRLADVLAPGARVTIEHDPAWTGDDPGREWTLVTSGTVESWIATGPTHASAVEITVTGDLAVLDTLLGWQVPTSPASGQSQAEYRTVTGPLETVFKTLARENITRLGLPITVVADQARGPRTTVQTRMHSLSDRLLAMADTAGLGLRVWQDDGGLVLDVVDPPPLARVLDDASGSVSGWTITSSAPSLTRVVVAGPGEGTERVFRVVIDADAERLWGIKEGFVDAREVREDDESGLSVAEQMDARGRERLAEARVTTGASVDLSAAAGVRLGRDLVLGRTVPVAAGGFDVTDRLREITLTWDATSGMTLAPTVGEVTDPDLDTITNAIAGTARGVARLGRV